MIEMFDGWAKIELGNKCYLLLFFENYFTLDTIGVYLNAESKPLMQIPAKGCGPKRIMGRMERNPAMMEVVGDSAEMVAGLINEARLEMLKMSEGLI